MVGDLFFNPQFEEAARYRDGLGDMSLAPFVALADIDQHGAGLINQFARLVDIDLLNRRAGFVENVLRGLGHILSCTVPFASWGISLPHEV